MSKAHGPASPDGQPTRERDGSVARSEEETRQAHPFVPPASELTLEQSATWARAYGAWLPEGSVLALHGELGAGKTTLVRALCEGLNVHDLESVTSPTFALLHEYDAARGVVVHADLYRLRSPDELDQLGWDELTSRAVATLVEWPERAAHRLPASTRHIFLEHVPHKPDVRSIRVA